MWWLCWVFVICIWVFVMCSWTLQQSDDWAGLKQMCLMFWHLCFVCRNYLNFVIEELKDPYRYQFTPNTVWLGSSKSMNACSNVDKYGWTDLSASRISAVPPPPPWMCFLSVLVVSWSLRESECERECREQERRWGGGGGGGGGENVSMWEQERERE